MNKSYKFNSISVDIEDGVYENIFNLETDKKIVDLSNYPIKHLRTFAFNGNSNIEKIILPEGLETIETWAVRNCINLKDVVIPESLKIIYQGEEFLNNSKIYYDETNWINNCFCYKGWLITIRGTDVKIPAGYKLARHITEFSSLAKLEISAGIKEIPQNFVEYSSSLTTIILNEGLEIINTAAFYAPNLTEIKIPSSVKKLGSRPFFSPILTKVNILNLQNWLNVEITGRPFIVDYDLYINNTLTKNITIPNGTTSIKDYTFCKSNIESITLPVSITQIGRESFGSCSKLTKLTFKGTKAQWNSIKKDYAWNSSSGLTYIQCTDGQVQL